MNTQRDTYVIPICYPPSLYSSFVSSFFSLLSSNLHVHSPTMLFYFSSTILPLCLSHMKTMVESMYRSSLSSPFVPILLLDHFPLFLWLTLLAGMRSGPVGTIASRAMLLGMYCARGCGRYLPLYVSRLLWPYMMFLSHQTNTATQK
jgi:hypothetical protein